MFTFLYRHCLLNSYSVIVFTLVCYSIGKSAAGKSLGSYWAVLFHFDTARSCVELMNRKHC